MRDRRRTRPVRADWAGRSIGLFLKNINAGVPFMLSGGLDADNVAEALRITRAPGVDVSSGVERGPGEKDPEKIRAFIRAARAAEAEIFSPPLQLGEGSIVRPVK